MQRFYRGPIRQRRRLHLLHRRRVLGGRHHAVAGAMVASLPSTGKKTSTFKDVRHPLPDGGVKEDGDKGQRAARPDGDLVLRRHQARRARDASRPRRGRVLGIRLREILREQLGGTYGVSVGYRHSLPRRLWHDDRAVRQLAREHREADRRRARPKWSGCEARARRRRRGEVQETGAPRPRDLAASEQLLDGSLQTVHLLGWDPTASRAARSHRVAHRRKCCTRPSRSTSRDRYTVVTLQPDRSQQAFGRAEGRPDLCVQAQGCRRGFQPGRPCVLCPSIRL